MSEVHTIYLRVAGGETIKIYPKKFYFSGGEVQVNVFSEHLDKELDSIALKSRISSSEELIETVMLCNALVHTYPSTAIDLMLPYLPYARQDRVCAPGEAFGLQAMAGILAMLPVRKIIVDDIHSDVLGKMLPKLVNVELEDCLPVFSELDLKITDGYYTLVCPDKGAVGRVEALSESFRGKPEVIYAEKVRDPSTGEITHTEVCCGNLDGQNLLICDDICDGGRTFTELAKVLKEKGAESVDLYVTHGIFSKGLDVFDGLINHIYTTRSFPAKYYDSTDSRITRMISG